jgi:hypothetical protein
MSAGEQRLRRLAARATAIGAIGALAVAGAGDAGATTVTGFGVPVGKTTRVPRCALHGLKPPSPLRPPHRHLDPDRIRALTDRFQRRIRRYERCIRHYLGTISRLGISFVLSLQRGNERRACKLLTGTERVRLGGSGCEQTLGEVEGRLRAERDPQLEETQIDDRHQRGELTIRLVRPFEKVGLRFAAKHGFWRISNVRDLLRQQPTDDPIAIASAEQSRR